MAQVKAGIYLEQKKGVIGTGHTAKEEEYRNFWMTVMQKGDEVVCILLDNDFKPTGIKQSLPAGAFESGRLTYIPQGEKRYQILINKLKEKNLAAQKKAQAQKPAAPAEEQKPRGWWEAPEKDIKPGDIFKRDDTPSEKSKGTTSSGQWWDPHPKNLTAEDIFGRGNVDRNGAKKPAKPSAAKNLKKSWWDK